MKTVDTRWAAVLPALLPALLMPRALASQEPARLEEVIVTSSRIEVPRRELATAVSVITGEEIQLRGYHSVADVLRTQPGVGASNSGGAGKPTAVRIRGEEGYRTLVLIDGVEVSDPTRTQVAPAFEHLLATSDLERVEILRGPQGFMYGADAGGVVNVLTRTGGGDFRGQANAEFGRFGTRRLDANYSGGTGRGDFFVSLADIESDGYNARVSDTDLADEDGYGNTTFHAKLGWTPTDALRLQLVARDTDAKNEYDACFLINDCTDFSQQTTSRLSADYRGERLLHLFALADTDIRRENFSAGTPAFSARGEIGRFEYMGSYQAGEAATLVYGMDLENEAIVGGSGETLERRQNGYYLEYRGRLNERWFISAGARLDDNDDFGEHTSVRATTGYLQDLGGGSVLKYRAGFGTGFRAPSLAETAYNASAYGSGVVLSEESSRGYDMGVEYLGANGLYFEATYFEQEIEDEIHFDLLTFSGYLQSPGIGRSKGVELAAEYSIGAQWELLGNWTLNATENIDGLQRLRRPEQLGNLGVRFLASGGRFRLLANYRMARNAVDEVFGLGRVPLQDYAVLDVSAAFAVSGTLQAHARLENVTDEDYREVAGYNTPGLRASVGVRVRY